MLKNSGQIKSVSTLKSRSTSSISFLKYNTKLVWWTGCATTFASQIYTAIAGGMVYQIMTSPFLSLFPKIVNHQPKPPNCHWFAWNKHFTNVKANLEWRRFRYNSAPFVGTLWMLRIATHEKLRYPRCAPLRINECPLKRGPFQKERLVFQLSIFPELGRFNFFQTSGRI